MQETFFRYYNFYLYTLTRKETLILTTTKQFEMEEQPLQKLEAGKLIPPREIEDLKQFFSEEELLQIEKENEYMLRGPGRIERIMREEMEKLAFHMEDKIKRQDEEFLLKVNPPGKK